MRRGDALTPEDAALIAGADTFFIASRSAAPGRAQGKPEAEGQPEVQGWSRAEGLDMSHRGGPAGFVRLDGARRLSFPDYRGNFFFNTIGNLVVDPRCGLLFLDFATGATLQIAGRGRALLEPEACAPWPGAERAVAVEIDEVVATDARSRLGWEFLGYAPQFAA